jgi:hypothetical protein
VEPWDPSDVPQPFAPPKSCPLDIDKLSSAIMITLAVYIVLLILVVGFAHRILRDKYDDDNAPNWVSMTLVIISGIDYASDVLQVGWQRVPTSICFHYHLHT